MTSPGKGGLLEEGYLNKYVKHCIFETLLFKSTDYMHHMVLFLSLCRGLNSLQVSRYTLVLMFYSSKRARHCISLFLRVKKKTRILILD